MIDEDIIYVKICPLVNGIPDTENETLLRSEIKKIFANAKNLNFDHHHDNIFCEGIRIVENYINESDELIQQTVIPAGSWIMVLAITLQSLITAIRQGTVTGVSLRTELGKNILLYDPIQPGEGVPYDNIQNKEALQPSTISFTDDPANQLPIEVMTHSTYTAKSRKKKTTEDKNMTEPKTGNENESEVSFLRSIIRPLFTAKTAGVAEPQQETQTTQYTRGDEKFDEFISNLIESQKVIPTLVEAVQVLKDGQATTNENIAKLITTVSETKDNLAELKVEVSEIKSNNADESSETTEETEATETEATETETEAGAEESTNDADETTTVEEESVEETSTATDDETSETPEDTETPEPETETEATETETETSTDEETEGETDTEKDEDEDKKTQGYTAKTRKEYNTGNHEQEYTMQQFIVDTARNFSYDKLMHPKQ